MLNYKVMIPLFLCVFVWQGVADAASISTRVRVLESKVAKHDKQVKQSASLREAQDTKIEKGLAQIQKLEKKVDKLLKEPAGNASKHLEPDDKRYAFP